jgi:hypothetical protein
MNYKAHGDLSWFRPLLGGNSPTSSGLILKMNMCYKEVSRARDVHVMKEKMDLVPLAEG